MKDEGTMLGQLVQLFIDSSLSGFADACFLGSSPTIVQRELAHLRVGIEIKKQPIKQMMNKNVTLKTKV